VVKEAIKKAGVLIEALPYIKDFHKKITVIKYGGSILSEERVRKAVLEDIAFLRYTGIRPILVHGGGPNITEELRKLKISSEFSGGFRVTNKATLEVVSKELDKLNKVIVDEINSHGIKAVGFKSDAKILKAKKKTGEVDLGFVGDVVGFDRKHLIDILPEAIPVICPMGICEDGFLYNINADEVACYLAAQMHAEKLVLLTNVLGVMRDPKDEESLISSLSISDVEDLIESKIIDSGMIPKVNAGIHAIEKGVKKAHIIDAKIPHALLLEIFTNEGIGTEIVS